MDENRDGSVLMGWGEREEWRGERRFFGIAKGVFRKFQGRRVIMMGNLNAVQSSHTKKSSMCYRRDC